MGVNVLSLFDGISCGQIALERAGIEVDNYFASEIDKHAIKATQHNYPDTIQIGSVLDVKGNDLPTIDLLIGGSPCQGFSRGSNRIKGMNLNFEDPRSKLFFEYVRLLKEVKPKYFLLENVGMKQEWQDIISEYLGVQPIKINASLVSAQRRIRLYWTNIPGIEQPEDKHINLHDILDDINDGFVNKASITSRKSYSKWVLVCNTIHSNKSNCITARGHNTILSNIKSEILENPWKENRDKWREYTSNELCRLQTIEPSYLIGIISKTQIRRAIGNGWTVDVIVHILQNMTNIINKQTNNRKGSKMLTHLDNIKKQVAENSDDTQTLLSLCEIITQINGMVDRSPSWFINWDQTPENWKIVHTVSTDTNQLSKK